MHIYRDDVEQLFQRACTLESHILIRPLIFQLMVKSHGPKDDNQLLKLIGEIKEKRKAMLASCFWPTCSPEVIFLIGMAITIALCCMLLLGMATLVWMLTFILYKLTIRAQQFHHLYYQFDTVISLNEETISMVDLIQQKNPGVLSLRDLYVLLRRSIDKKVQLEFNLPPGTKLTPTMKEIWGDLDSQIREVAMVLTRSGVISGDITAMFESTRLKWKKLTDVS